MIYMHIFLSRGVYHVLDNGDCPNKITHFLSYSEIENTIYNTYFPISVYGQHLFSGPENTFFSGVIF